MSLADKINPVALKELRQMVRSKTLNVAIVLFLLQEVVSSLLIALSSKLNDHSGLSQGQSFVGETIFHANLVPLALVVMIVVPMMTFVRVVREKSPKETDLQYATMLSPLSFVNGKLLCALIVTLMFVFGTLPVMSLAYLLRGVAISNIFFMFVLSIVCSLFVNVVVIILGASSIPTPLKWVVMIGEVVIGGFYFCMALMVLVFENDFPIDIPLEVVPVIVMSLLIAFALLWSLGLACFSSEVSNRFKALKITYVISELASLLLSATGMFGAFNPCDAIAIWGIVSVFAACGFALFMSGCQTQISRRVRMDVMSSKMPKVLSYFITTGAENGIVLAFILGGLSMCAIFADFNEPEFHDGIRRILIFFLYFFGHLMLFRGIWLRLPSRNEKFTICIPIVVMAAQVVLLVFSQMISAIPDSSSPYSEQYVFVPFSTFDALLIERHGFIDSFSWHLLGGLLYCCLGAGLIGKNWVRDWIKKPE